VLAFDALLVAFAGAAMVTLGKSERSVPGAEVPGQASE
jgi:hypothetical protein